MSIMETDLPGVGKKFIVPLDNGKEIIIIAGDTGKKELFIKEEPEGDNKKLFECSSELSRKIGAILEGAYFRPVSTKGSEPLIGEDAEIERYEVPKDSNLADKTLEEASFYKKTEVAIMSIRRDNKSISNINPTTKIKSGDVLLVVGSPKEQEEFKKFLM